MLYEVFFFALNAVSSGVHGSPSGMVGAEKRPAPSSVSAYGFDDDEDEDDDVDEDEDDEDDGGGGRHHHHSGGPTQCQPSASKRSRRALGKRMKGSAGSVVGGAVVAGAGAKSGASGGAGGVVQGAVAAALASRPAVAPSPPLQGCSSWDVAGGNDGPDRGGGYNSEDEYSHLGVNLTDEEWEAKDRRFEKAMRKKGYIIKHMGDDGSCLFRAVADQVTSFTAFVAFFSFSK